MSSSSSARLHRTVLLALAAVLALALAPLHAAPPSAAFSHFRVLWMENPAEKAVISWTTPTEDGPHVVHYDVQPREGKLSAYAHRAVPAANGRFTLEAADAGTPPGWYHHALLEGLQPATTYHFVVTNGGKVSREFHFITAPADNRPVKLISGGDSRRPPELPQPHLDRRSMNRLIARLAEENPDVVAFAHGGDYCTRAEWRFMSDWLSDHELTITSTGRILPIIPSRGNHDRHVGFEEIFLWPGRTHDYHYVTALSGRVAFLTLNTEISRVGNQRDWLEAELARQRQTAGRTVVVQYHIPAYGSVKSPQQGELQRQHWVPLFEKYRVDLVCESDHHMLKRTVPIFEDRHDPARGIVYIGDGGLGVPQREPDLTRWYLKSPGFAAAAHHVHLLEFADDEIRGRAIGMNRETLDEFVIRPRPAP
jgi:acid phosphatase type 7